MAVGVAMKASFVISLVLVTISSLSSAQYPRIYPNVTEDGTKHLNFGLMQVLTLFGFDISTVYVPGVQVALDQINDDPTMLPGYTLHYTLVDSKVSFFPGIV